MLAADLLGRAQALVGLRRRHPDVRDHDVRRVAAHLQQEIVGRRRPARRRRSRRRASRRAMPSRRSTESSASTTPDGTSLQVVHADHRRTASETTRRRGCGVQRRACRAGAERVRRTGARRRRGRPTGSTRSSKFSPERASRDAYVDVVPCGYQTTSRPGRRRSDARVSSSHGCRAGKVMVVPRRVRHRCVETRSAGSLRQAATGVLTRG